MKKELKYLHLEDEDSIVNLTKRLLEKEGYAINCTHLQDREAFLSEIEKNEYDLIIADYVLPDFDGLSALDLLRERNQDVPFILFSGSIGEEKAIDSLRRGATDYVLKQNVSTLVPAVKRTLEEAHNRNIQRKMQQELEQSKANLHLVLDNLQAGVLLIEKETRKIVDVNFKGAEMLGKPRQEIIGNDYNAFICPAESNKGPAIDPGEEVENSELQLRTYKGTEITVLKSVVQIMIDDRPHLLESFVDISRQKKMEKEITGFGRILDNTLNEIYIFDAETYRFLKLNRGAKENIGYDGEEYKQQTPLDLKKEFTYESFTNLIAPLKSGEVNKLNFTTTHQRKNGTTYPVEVFLQMTTYEDKPAIVAFISDISERLRSEKIRQTMFEIAAANIEIKKDTEFYALIQQKLSALIDTSNFIIAKYNKENDTIIVKYMRDQMDRLQELGAFPAQESISAYVIKNKTSVLLNEDESEAFFAKHQIKWVGTPAKCWLGVPLVVNDEAIGLIVVQSYEKSGLYRQEDLQLLEFVAGQLAESIKRKEMESKMYQLFLSVEQSPVTTVITDLQGNIQYVNPKFCEVTGYTFEEAIGQNPRILKSGEMSLQDYKNLWDTITNGKVWRGRFHNKKKNGELFWEDATIGPIKNKQGQTTHYLAIKEDITERVAAEHRLNLLHRQNEILLASFPSVLMVMDKDERIIRWNKKAEEIFKLSWETVRHKYLLKVPLTWDWEMVSEAILSSKHEKRSVPISDVAFEKKDGGRGFLNITVVPFVGNENIIDGYLIHAEDITEMKIAQGRQVQAQKLESIGQLAAGIAHEINTPVQYVSDNIFFLQDSFNDLGKLLKVLLRMQSELQDSSEITSLFGEIKNIIEASDLEFLMDEIPAAIAQALEGTNKVSQIVRAMKEFSHPGKKEKKVMDLRHAIENTIIVSKNEWKYVADVQTDFDDELQNIFCYPDEFNQVILNLIINAAHAIEEKVGNSGNKGNIVIKSRKHNGNAEIIIADDGKGITKDIQDKIFDPFFTTKDVGKGTGQGLAIAYDVIHNKHGGNIHVESGPGKGATFIIQLPSNSPGEKKELENK